MTKDELKTFLCGAYFNGYAYEDYDSCGNRNWGGVYEKNGKLYQVDFCDDSPCEKWGDMGYIRGEYEAIEVIRKTRIVEEVYYEPIVKE